MKKLKLESINGNFIEIQEKINELVDGYNELAGIEEEKEKKNSKSAK